MHSSAITASGKASSANAAWNFGAEAKTDAQLGSRAILGDAGIGHCICSGDSRRACGGPLANLATLLVGRAFLLARKKATSGRDDPRSRTWVGCLENKALTMPVGRASRLPRTRAGGETRRVIAMGA